MLVRRIKKNMISIVFSNKAYVLNSILFENLFQLLNTKFVQFMIWR